MNEPSRHLLDSIDKLKCDAVYQWPLWGTTPRVHTPEAEGGGEGRADGSSISAGESISSLTTQALQSPVDFPPLSSAIVPGDHVVLAVDPSTPDLCGVIQGAVASVGESGAKRLDIVVWDEANDQTLALIKQTVDSSSRVVRHQGSNRCDVRYLAASDAAEPIYLNRLLVDADLVLPIFPLRCDPEYEQIDASGIFPMLVDSGTRYRSSSNNLKASADGTAASATQAAWLLGVQLYLAVVPDSRGRAIRVIAGTNLAIRDLNRELIMDGQPDKSSADSVESPFDLVIATFEDHAELQTWNNIARAATVAESLASEDSTIVLWTDISVPLASLVTKPQPEYDDEFSEESEVMIEEDEAAESSEDEDFPAWDVNADAAKLLNRLIKQRRVIIKSKVDSTEIESLGFGAIEDLHDLIRLSEGFQRCCVVPAACYRRQLVSTGQP